MSSGNRAVSRSKGLGGSALALAIGLASPVAWAQSIDSPATTSPQAASGPAAPSPAAVPERQPADPFKSYSALAFQIKTHSITFADKDVNGAKWPGATISATTYALRSESVLAAEIGVSTVTSSASSSSRSPFTLGLTAMTGSFMLYQMPKTTFRVGVVYPELAARLISNLDDWSLLNLSITLPAVRVSFWRALVDVRFGELAFDAQFVDMQGNSETTTESRSKLQFVTAWELRVGFLF